MKIGALLALSLVYGCVGKRWEIFSRIGSDERDPKAFAKPRRLTAGFESNFAISINDDEGFGYFVSNRAGNSDIWSKKLSGGSSNQVTFHSADDLSPSISPDGKYLAFISRRSDATGDLHILNLGIQIKNYFSTNEGESQAVSLPLTAEQNPSWFPDSERIIFESSEPTRNAPPRLMTIDVDTMRSQPFHNLRGRNPKVARNGKLVTYTRQNGVYIYNLSNNKEYQITNGELYRDGQPYFHSQTTGIYFIRFNQDSNHDGEMNGDDLPTIWLSEFSVDSKEAIVSRVPYPITTASYGGYYPTHHGDSIYFTMLNINNLDVFSLPEEGHVARDNILTISTPRDPNDLIYILRRRAIKAVNEGRNDEALEQMKLEQRELGRLGSSAEAKTLMHFANRKIKLSEVDRGYFQVLALEAKYGDLLFPKSSVISANITASELNSLAGMKPLYTKSKELMAVTETLYARIFASREQWSNAIAHLDQILAADLSADYIAATLALKAKVLSSQGDHNAALQTLSIIFSKYPEQEHALNDSADYIIAQLRSQTPHNRLAATLGEIRINTQWPEPIKARAHLAQAVSLYEEKKYNLAANELKVLVEDYNNSDGALYQIFGLVAEWGENISIGDRSYIHSKLTDKLTDNPFYAEEARKRYIVFLMSRAAHYNGIKEPALAIKQFTSILKLDPENLPAHRGIILGYYQKGLLKQKRTYYLERQNDENPAWAYLATYVETFAIDQATSPKEKLDIIDTCIDRLTAVVRRDPTVAEYHLTLGWLHYQHHVWNRRYISEGSLRSKIANSWRITREFFGARAGDSLKEAIDSYLAALYLAREDATNRTNIQQNLAEAYYEAGNFGEALRYYLYRLNQLNSSPLASRPIAGNLFFKAATSAYQIDKLDLAIALQKRGIEDYEDAFKESRLAKEIDRLALYQDKAGYFDESLSTYQQLLARQVTGQNTFNYMITLGNVGRMQMQAGKHVEAKQTLKKHLAALSKIPSSDPAFIRNKSDVITINLDDEEAGVGRLSKDMRLLYAYTLMADNYQAMGELDSAYDALRKKRQLITTMRSQRSKVFSDKTFMAEHLAIVNNNIAIIETKLGLGEKASKSFLEAARYAEAHDPGEKKNNKPSQKNLLYAIESSLSVKYSHPIAGTSFNSQKVVQFAETALNSDRIEIDKEKIKTGVELLKSQNGLARGDNLLPDVKKSILDKNLVFQHYAQTFNFEGLFSELSSRDFSKVRLSNNERELLRRTVTYDCLQQRHECNIMLRKYWGILEASQAARKYKPLKFNTLKPAGTVILSEWQDQVVAMLSFQKDYELIFSTVDAFWDNLNRAVMSRDISRVYFLNNAALMAIMRKLPSTRPAFAIVGQLRQVQSFDADSRLANGSVGLIGTDNCSHFLSRGLLCKSLNENQDNLSENDHLVVTQSIDLHKMTNAVTINQRRILFDELIKRQNRSLRSLIINGELKYLATSWRDYITADLIYRLAQEAESHGMSNVFIFNHKLEDKFLAEWLQSATTTPLSRVALPREVTLLPIGQVGKSKAELQRLAEEQADSLLERFENLLDDKKPEEALAVKRQILYVSRILEDQAWELDLLEELVLLEFSLRRYDPSLFFQIERLRRLPKTATHYADEVLNAGILAVRANNSIEAERQLSRAAPLFVGKPSKLAKLHYYFALYYEQIRDYPAAIRFYTSSRKNSLAAGEDFLASQRLLNLATLYKERTNEFYKAIKHYRLAVREFAEQDEFESRFRASLDLANTYLAMGQAGPTLDLLDKLSDDAEDTSLSDMLQYYQFKANAYYRSGQYQKSEEVLNGIFKNLSDLENEELRRLIELDATNLQAMVIAKIGDHKKGLKILRDGIETARQFGFEAHVATRFNNIGYLLREIELYKESIESFAEALKIDRKLRSRENVAFDQRNLGLSHILMQRFDQAAQFLNASLKESLELGLNYNTAYCYFGLANLEIQQANYQRALAYYESALKISQKNLLQDFIWKAHAGIAEIQVKLNQDEKAIDSYISALTVIERLRAGLVSTSAKTGFQSDAGVQSVYEGYIDLLMKNRRIKEAWNISERARARAFIDSMGLQKIKPSDEAVHDLVRQQRELKAEIDATQVLVNASESTKERSSLTSRLENQSKRLADLNNQILEKAPEISQFNSVQAITTEEVQTSIVDGQQVVQYHLSANRIHIWVIGSRTFSGYSVPVKREELAIMTAKFHELLENYASMRFNINELSQALIEPIRSDINKTSELVIIPHGFLHHLPFGALNLDTEKKLIDQFSLSFLESASMLQFVPLYKELNKDNILVVGNPNRGHSLDLPFAAKEAYAIQRYFPSAQVFTGQTAGVKNFLELAPNADVIHLATHGVFDEMNPMESKLMLSPSSDHSGDLQVKDLFSIRIKASLVTLSACETGIGKITTGDEIIGLNRAFFYAGADSLISSLWRVSDVASAITMKRFYRYLGEGYGRAAALRKAQLLVREFFDHPAYWAPFKLIGARQ